MCSPRTTATPPSMTSPGSPARTIWVLPSRARCRTRAESWSCAPAIASPSTSTPRPRPTPTRSRTRSSASSPRPRTHSARTCTCVTCGVATASSICFRLRRDWNPWSSASAKSPGRCAAPRARPGRTGPSAATWGAPPSERRPPPAASPPRPDWPGLDDPSSPSASTWLRLTWDRGRAHACSSSGRAPTRARPSAPCTRSAHRTCPSTRRPGAHANSPRDEASAGLMPQTYPLLWSAPTS